MLWYNAWLETRWRFVIGVVVLMLSACSLVLGYPRALNTLSQLPQTGGDLGQRIADSAAIVRDYRSFIWTQWFRLGLREWFALFAVLLGTGGLLSQATRGGALFTLSLPVSRDRLLGVRATTALAELLGLALASSLAIPLLSPAIGQTYSVTDALVYGTSLFIAGSVLFSLAFLLSTVFSDLWRPPLIALCVVIGLRLIQQAVGLGSFSLLAYMSAESYFHGTGIPWVGLIVTAGISAAMLYGAMRNIARQDF